MGCIVHGVAKSRSQLSYFHFSNSKPEHHWWGFETHSVRFHTLRFRKFCSKRAREENCSEPMLTTWWPQDHWATATATFLLSNRRGIWRERSGLVRENIPPGSFKEGLGVGAAGRAFWPIRERMGAGLAARGWNGASLKATIRQSDPPVANGGGVASGGGFPTAEAQVWRRWGPEGPGRGERCRVMKSQTSLSNWTTTIWYSHKTINVLLIFLSVFQFKYLVYSNEIRDG